MRVERNDRVGACSLVLQSSDIPRSIYKRLGEKLDRDKLLESYGYERLENMVWTITPEFETTPKMRAWQALWSDLYDARVLDKMHAAYRNRLPEPETTLSPWENERLRWAQLETAGAERRNEAQDVKAKLAAETAALKLDQERYKADIARVNAALKKKEKEAKA